MPEASVAVNWTDDEIVATYPSGEKQAVRWESLTRVAIRTTSEGPFSPDVFWDLHAGRDDRPAVVYPGGATGETELLEELQKRLPGFDNDALITAMSCTSHGYFIVWQRAA
jgi:hypothetical protein